MTNRVILLAIGQRSHIAGDHGAAEAEAQSPVEIERKPFTPFDSPAMATPFDLQ